MTLDEFLNQDIDLNTLAAMARQGLIWWLDELRSMAPPSWRARLSPGARVLIEPRHGGGWSCWKDGRLLDGAPGPAPAASVGLLLPARQVLVREISTPPMPTSDVRRMLAMDIDRLSPLAPDRIFFDFELVEGETGDGKRHLRLGIVARDAVFKLLAEAREDGFEPVSIGLRDDTGEPGAHLDFLPAARAAAGERPPSRARTYWWTGAAALVVLNLAILVGLDISDVARLRKRVEAQAPVASAVIGLRQRVLSEDTRRRALVAQGRRAEPLHVLDALSEAIPTGAWLHHLEWNGQTLRIVGLKSPDVDIAASLRDSGLFINARALTAQPPGAATSLRPFDFTAEARPPARS